MLAIYIGDDKTDEDAFKVRNCKYRVVGCEILGGRMAIILISTDVAREESRIWDLGIFSTQRNQCILFPQRPIRGVSLFVLPLI